MRTRHSTHSAACPSLDHEGHTHDTGCHGFDAYDVTPPSHKQRLDKRQAATCTVAKLTMIALHAESGTCACGILTLCNPTNLLLLSHEPKRQSNELAAPLGHCSNLRVLVCIHPCDRQVARQDKHSLHTTRQAAVSKTVGLHTLVPTASCFVCRCLVCVCPLPQGLSTYPALLRKEWQSSKPGTATHCKAFFLYNYR